MAKLVITTFCIALLISVTSTPVYANLKTLMRLGANQAKMAKALKEETRNYNNVRKAIVSGKLKEGMSADKIRKKYGDPIMDNIFDKKRNAYKWIYMPATSNHFEGEKLYLFVNDNSELVGWKLINQPE